MDLERIRRVLEGNICSNDGECFYDCDTCNKARKALTEYAEAEKKGLLLKLPCIAGTKVYRVWKTDDRIPVISEHTAELKFIIDNLDKFGKTLFLSRKDAEEALKVGGINEL